MKKTLIILVSALIMLSNSGDANTQQAWDTLPDGRVVIQVFNERLAFDPKDKDIVNDKIGDYSSVYFRNNGSADTKNYLSLKQAIEDRPRAEAFFEQVNKSHWSDDGVELVFVMARGLPPEKQYNGLFVGKFPYDAVWGNHELRFVIHSKRPLEPNHNNRNPLPHDPWLNKKYGPDENGITGFFTIQIKWHPEIPPSSEVVEARFMMPAAKRLAEAKYDLHVSYNMLRGFETALNTDDELIDFYYGWEDGAYLFKPTARTSNTDQYFRSHFSHFQKKDWPRLDDMARKIAAYIFIDRRTGDFE